MTAVPRLLLITDRTQTGGRHLEDVVADCAEAGIRHVLLRERDLPADVYDALLARLRERVSDTATILTRDPRPDSPGCHLAENALRPGDDTGLVGRSVHDAEGVRRAIAESDDFVVAGPYRPTTSKPGYGPPLGVAGIRALVANPDSPPLLAVGGVRPHDLEPLAVAGASGAAVMGPLMRAPDPHSLALEYVSAAAAFATSTNPKEQP